jgi:hypothetical protein
MLVFLFTPSCLKAQPTSGELSGKVYWEDGAIAPGATVILTHLPTGTRYRTISNRLGLFFFSGLHPGNGYKLEANHIQGKGILNELFRIDLGEVTHAEINLKETTQLTKEVVVYAKRISDTGTEGQLGFVIKGEELQRWASGSKSLQDLFRVLPEVKTDGNGDGSISVAGQNYRYNALYTDGVVSHDLFGISASGSYGGQTGISPVSLEAIETSKLVTTPMDAMQGHFTGAAIHTITKRGSNQGSTSAYHFFQHPKLAGTLEQEREAGWHPESLQASTSGISTQGTLKKNRLFYFFHAEEQRRQIPYFKDVSQYPGNLIRKNWLPIIRNQLISEYGYDPGSFQEAQEIVEGQKLLLRLDGNISNHEQMVFIGRYLQSMMSKPVIGAYDEIHFANNGYRFQSLSYHLSLEYKRTGKKNTAGQWLLQLTQSDDRRKAISNPFPSVKILDNDGAAFLGTDINSQHNQTKQTIVILRKQSQRMLGKHFLTVGAEWMWGKFRHHFIPAAFGYFIFSSPRDFILRRNPIFYRKNQGQIATYTIDKIPETDPIQLLDGAAYGSIRYKISEQVTGWLGARIQKTWFMNKVSENLVVNEEIIPLFVSYRPLNIGLTGQRPKLRWAFNPKAAIEWKGPGGLTWQSAIALQSGRLPVVWPVSLYANNGDQTRGFMTGGSGLGRFRLLPNWASAAGINQLPAAANQIPLHLMSTTMSLPSQLRFHNKLIMRRGRQTWYAECLITRQLQEPRFTQLNLLPSQRISPGAGGRKVYTLMNNAALPLPGGATHPFNSSILLSSLSNSGAGSTVWKVGGMIRISEQSEMEWSYANNNTLSWQDATGSLFSSVWQQTETVQGKNDPELSPSEFGNREKWVVGFRTGKKTKDNRLGWTLSMIWIGQSGDRYSYVYTGNSLVRDNGVNGFNELMYVPTREEVMSMEWLPFHNGIRPIPAADQAEAMEQWIQTQPYLMKRRGSFAQRNGAELPFNWQCDLKFEQRIPFVWLGQKGTISFTLECFNLAALLFPGGGQKWIMPDGRYPGIRFMGYRDENSLTPVFQCDPEQLFRSPQRETISFSTGKLSRWLIQPGLKIILH